MTATHDSGATRPARWLHGLKRTRLVLAAAALAFGALWVLGAIAAGPALAGFALIAAAVLIATANAETTPAFLPRAEPRAPRIGDPLIEAVLTGLPDPVGGLDPRCVRASRSRSGCACRRCRRRSATRARAGHPSVPNSSSACRSTVGTRP